MLTFAIANLINLLILGGVAAMMIDGGDDLPPETLSEDTTGAGAEDMPADPGADVLAAAAQGPGADAGAVGNDFPNPQVAQGDEATGSVAPLVAEGSSDDIGADDDTAEVLWGSGVHDLMGTTGPAEVSAEGQDMPGGALVQDAAMATDAEVTKITGFDADEDVLELVYSGQAFGAAQPDVAVTDLEDGTGAAISVDDTVVAHVAGAQGLDPSQIVLTPV